MAGRPKAGLDYAGWSVNIFDGDTKIDKLLDAQGWIGFSIYFYLCQMAYKFDGYFYRWTYDDSATTARRMGGGIGSETVRNTVGLCLQIGLFDKPLFDRDGILTSRGIQRRYTAAIQGRRVKTVIADYWLLDNEESKGLDKCASNPYFMDAESHLQAADDDLQGADWSKSKGKESKGKESKGEDAAVAAVMSAFLNKINPMASQTCLDELKGYVEEMGPDCCLRAFDIALDSKKTTWAYIKGILRSKLSQGVRCIADWDALEEKRNGGGGKAKDVASNSWMKKYIAQRGRDNGA